MYEYYIKYKHTDGLQQQILILLFKPLLVFERSGEDCVDVDDMAICSGYLEPLPTPLLPPYPPTDVFLLPPRIPLLCRNKLLYDVVLFDEHELIVSLSSQFSERNWKKRRHMCK